MKNCAANNKEAVKFTFDMRRESDYNTSELYRVVSEVEDWHNFLFSKISFECSRDNARLQVGDLLAREAMKALDNQVGPVKRDPRKSWMALYNTGRFHVDAIGDGWFDSLKDQMSMLENDTRMSRAGYLEWLKKNKRQHNTTNLFLYMEWTATHSEEKE
jgi:hypothetical protein